MTESEAGLFDFASVPECYRAYLQPTIFDPWAHELLDFAPPPPGGIILDVAAGTGAVAHAAARLVGPAGRVIAADVSPLMLAMTTLAQSDDGAPVEALAGPADHLDLSDAAVDAAYCQQGLQFMPDRAAVLREMRRVMRPGGVAGLAVWSETAWPEPFDTYARVLIDHGVAEPYPKAFDTSTVTMSEREIELRLDEAGFGEIEVQTVVLPLVWLDPMAAAHGVMGSSYGPSVAALDRPAQKAIFDDILSAFSAGPRATTAVLGRGRAQ